MFTRRVTLAASRKTILPRAQCRFQASPADTRIGSAVTRNPLLSVGLGVATAVAGYTVFCYSKTDEPDVKIDDSLAGHPKAARPAAYGKHGSIEDQINEDAKRKTKEQKGKDFKDKASEKLDDAKDKAKDAKDDAKQKGQELKDRNGDEGSKSHLQASRESEDREVAPSGAGSKSKAEGNASTRRATNPNEQEEKPTSKSSGKASVYPSGDEINKADNLSLDGGSRVGRDGQAKTDRAKIIERAGAQEGQEKDIDDGSNDARESQSSKADQQKQASQQFDDLTNKSLQSKESARDKINKFQQSALRDQGTSRDDERANEDDDDATSNIGHHVTGSASRGSANPRDFSAGSVTNRPTNNESVRNFYIEKVRENDA